MAGYLSWEYGNDSNSGTAANAPKLTWASLDNTIGNDEIIYVQKTEKPLVMDSEGNSAFLKWTNNSTSVVVQTSSSVRDGSPATDTSFDDSVFDTSNTMALDFIASQYDTTSDLPGQPYSQSIWYGVKSVSSGVITLNDEWYHTNEEESTITARAVYASGSYDVNSSSTSTSDSTGYYISSKNGVEIIGGCTFDGSSTWTLPDANEDDESVMRNLNNHSTGYNTIDGGTGRLYYPYGCTFERLTYFNFNYSGPGYVLGPMNCIFRNYKIAWADYAFYINGAHNCVFESIICSQVNMPYLVMTNDCLFDKFYNFGVINSTSTSLSQGMRFYNSFGVRVKNYFSAGKLNTAVARLEGSGNEVIFEKPKIVNPFNGGAQTDIYYAAITVMNSQRNSIGHAESLLYKPSGWKDNPAGNTYGLYAANIYLQNTATQYQRSSIPFIRVVSGSNAEHERTYFMTWDVQNANDDEIGYIEKSGSGYLAQGQSIAFHPKFGDSGDSDDLTSGVEGVPFRNSGFKYSGSDSPWQGAPLNLPFEFPVSESSKLKVSFFAKDDSSFNGNFSQVFTGTFDNVGVNAVTGSISKSILTTSWKQYHTISPPVPENTVLTCHFLCSGSAGQAALDQISASYE